MMNEQQSYLFDQIRTSQKEFKRTSSWEVS